MTTRLKWITIAIGTAVVVSTLALWFLWLAPQPRVLIVGSTTTTQDTGLLDVMQAEYTRQTGRPVRIVVAVERASLQQRWKGVLIAHLAGFCPRGGALRADADSTASEARRWQLVVPLRRRRCRAE